MYQAYATIELFIDFFELSVGWKGNLSENNWIPHCLTKPQTVSVFSIDKCSGSLYSFSAIYSLTFAARWLLKTFTFEYLRMHSRTFSRESAYHSVVSIFLVSSKTVHHWKRFVLKLSRGFIWIVISEKLCMCGKWHALLIRWSFVLELILCLRLAVLEDYSEGSL